MFSDVLLQACILVAVCSVIPLTASACAGLMVGLFQSVTQIQDSSFPYLIKAVAVAATLGIGGHWAFLRCVTFLGECMGFLPQLGRMP